MQQPIVISTNGLSVGYADKIILQEINIQIPKNSVVAVLGLNGSGKSTLLRTLAGLQPKLNGEIIIEDTSQHLLSASALSKKVSVILSGRGDVVQGLLVHELFSTTRTFTTDTFGKLSSEDVNIIDQTIQQLNIEKLVDKRMYQLSDGEAQMVFIARALIQQTPIIFMDEPTSYLDIIHKMEIFSLIKSLSKKEKTILFTSHELDLAIQIADYCLLIAQDGKHIFGNKNELLQSGKVEEFFTSKYLSFDKVHQRFDLKFDL